MNLLAKIGLATMVAGAGVGGMYAAPAGPAMPVDQMLAKAATIGAQVHDDYQHVLHMQALARKEKDVIKLNCVNDKLVLIKPEMNIVDRARADLQTSREGGDQRVALDTIIASGDSVRRLREGAEACIGEKLLMTEASNDFTHPEIPGNPEGDPYGINAIEPPAYASPFD